MLEVYVLQQRNVVKLSVLANCCVWNDTPVEMHGLQITLWQESCSYFLVLTQLRIKYTSDIAACWHHCTSCILQLPLSKHTHTHTRAHTKGRGRSSHNARRQLTQRYCRITTADSGKHEHVWTSPLHCSGLFVAEICGSAGSGSGHNACCKSEVTG